MFFMSKSYGVKKMCLLYELPRKLTQHPVEKNAESIFHPTKLSLASLLVLMVVCIHIKMSHAILLLAASFGTIHLVITQVLDTRELPGFALVNISNG